MKVSKEKRHRQDPGSFYTYAHMQGHTHMHSVTPEASVHARVTGKAAPVLIPGLRSPQLSTLQVPQRPSTLQDPAGWTAHVEMWWWAERIWPWGAEQPFGNHFGFLGALTLTLGWLSRCFMLWATLIYHQNRGSCITSKHPLVSHKTLAQNILWVHFFSLSTSLLASGSPAQTAPLPPFH